MLRVTKCGQYADLTSDLSEVTFVRVETPDGEYVDLSIAEEDLAALVGLLTRYTAKSTRSQPVTRREFGGYPPQEDFSAGAEELGMVLGSDDTSPFSVEDTREHREERG